MANRHRSISIAFLHHKRSQRFTYDITATYNNAFLSLRRDIVALQKFEDAERRSRDKARQS